MRGKSILALAVALAMIFSVIPAFGLTASAATAGDTFKKDNVKYKIVGENKFTNGSFETGIDDWKAYNQGEKSLSSHWTQSADQARDGEHSLHADVIGGWSGANNDNNLQTYIPIDANKKYVLRFSEFWNGAVSASNGGHMTAAAVSKGKGSDKFDDSVGGWNSWANKSQRTFAREANKWIDYEYILDTTNPAVSSEKELYVVIAYSFQDCPGLYLDAFELYEIQDVPYDATVSVKYVDEDGTDIKTVEFDKLYSGDEFTYTPDTWVANDACTEFYAPDDAEERKITALQTSVNTITINCSKLTFADAELPQGTIAVDGKFYDVEGTTNLIPNPSFETTDGQYTYAGWFGGSQSGESLPNTNAYPNPHQIPSQDAAVGEYSFGSRWRDPAKGFCTLLTNFDLEQNKTYYFACDVKFAAALDPASEAKIDLGIADGLKAVAADIQTIDIGGTVSKTDWTTFSKIITVNEDVADPYLYFNAYNIGAKDNRDPYPTPAYLFDNFRLVEVKESETAQVKVNYKAADKTVKTVDSADAETVENISGSETFSLVRDSEDNTLYYVNTKLNETLDIVNGEVNVPLAEAGNVFTVKEGKVFAGNITDNGVYNGRDNYGALNWGQNGSADRVGIAILDVADKDKPHYALDGTQVRRYGSVTVQFYAISLDDFNALDISDANKLKEKLTNEIASSNSGNDGETHYQIELDANAVKEAANTSNKAVILMNAYGGIFGMAKDGLSIVAGYKLTVDDASSIVTPGKVDVAAKDGVAAFKDENDKIYPVADGKATVDVQEDMSLTSVTYEDFGLSIFDGAQVRVGKAAADGKVNLKDTGSGLRFIGTVKPGSPAASASSIKVVITAADAEGEQVEIDITKYQDEANSVFTAALTNLKAQNYNRVFTATPVAVFEDGVEVAGKSVSRSIYEVAEGLLVKEDGTEDSIQDKPYTIEDTIVQVLNAYVNTVGVRIDLEVDGTAAVDADGYKGAKKGDGTADAFFKIESSQKGEGDSKVYTIVIQPIGDKVNLDENLILENIRINNNNSTAKKGVTVQKDENGTVTITFDSAQAVKD